MFLVAAANAIRCHVVPVLYRGLFDATAVQAVMDVLARSSVAAPGYNNPEGVIIYHVSSGAMFKKTFDDKPKGEAKQGSAETS